MKKIIALILSTVMILGSVGCKSKSKEETTKSKKTKDTEITETEKPSESSEDTETSATEDTTETEPTKETCTYTPMKVPYQVTHDGTSADVKVGLMQKGFSVPVKDVTDPYMSVATVAFKFYVAQPESANDKVSAVIDKIFRDKFSEKMDEYLEAVKKLEAQADSEPNLFSAWIEFDTNVYRDDSRVISFSTLDNTTNAMSYLFEYHNLDGNDGTEIEFKDVVKDKAALIAYVKDWRQRLQPEQVDTMIKHIEDDTIDFVLYTNGIELIYHEDNGYAVVSTFVQAFSCPDAFDTYYFEQTPADDYSVKGSDLGYILWDVNDDGELDNVSASWQGDNDAEIMISWNQDVFRFTEEDIPHLQEGDIYPDQNPIVYPQLMFTKDGCFLFVRAFGLKTCHLFTFKLENGEVKFCDALETYETWEYYSPDDFLFGFEKIVIGNQICYQDYKLDVNGKFAKVSENYVCYGNFITLKDLTVTKITDEGYSAGEMVLPSGTKVTTTSYSEEQNTVCLELQTNDKSDGQLVLLDLSTIDDMDSTFVYVFHGE